MQDRFNPKIVAAFDKCYCGKSLEWVHFPLGINDKWDNHALKLFKRGYYYYFLVKDFLFYLFLDRGREEERERNIHLWLPLMSPLLGTWPTAQACALTGYGTSDPFVCRPRSIHWATPARAIIIIFIFRIIYMRGRVV